MIRLAQLDPFPTSRNQDGGSGDVVRDGRLVNVIVDNDGGVMTQHRNVAIANFVL